MAKNMARRMHDAKGIGTTYERGMFGKTRPRADKSVRKANRIANGDARLNKAAADAEKHEQHLKELEASLAGQPHTPYRPAPDPEPIVEAPVSLPEPVVVSIPIIPPAWELDEPEPVKPDAVGPGLLRDAKQLIKDGYHIERVVQRTGWGMNYFESMVGEDGYRK